MTSSTDEYEEVSVGSADEALFELLGLESKDLPTDNDERVHAVKSLDDLLSISDEYIQEIVQKHKLTEVYHKDSLCILPEELSIPADIMRRLADEIVFGQNDLIDRTHETIGGERKQTRLENFVNAHKGWHDICHNYLRRCISAILQEPQVLYKEKLNLKPKGGNGFAPHLDTPSLRIALGEDGPQHFITVMVAIDNMTRDNGCLRICKGDWNASNSVSVVQPEVDGNPDAGGRAGAIPLDVANKLEYENLICKGGTIVAFGGFAPHRSGVNQSAFARRAVFLTYNPALEGDFHDVYYRKMQEKRDNWRRSVGLLTRDEQRELDALETVPQV